MISSKIRDFHKNQRYQLINVFSKNTSVCENTCFSKKWLSKNSVIFEEITDFERIQDFSINQHFFKTSWISSKIVGYLSICRISSGLLVWMSDSAKCANRRSDLFKPDFSMSKFGLKPATERLSGSTP